MPLIVETLFLCGVAFGGGIGVAYLILKRRNRRGYTGE